MLIIAAEQKSPDCLEESLITAASTYLCLPDVYSPCLEEVCIIFKKGNKLNLGRHPSKETREKMSQSHIGRLKTLGMTGKHHSDKTKLKIARRNKNKIVLEVTRAKLSKNAGSNPNYGMKGKRHNELTKRKIGITKIGNTCGFRKGNIPWNKGLPCPDNIKEILSKAWEGDKNPMKKPDLQRRFSILFTGKGNPMYGVCAEKHPRWKGGISFEPYCPKFNKGLKEKVRNRDNRTCQLCGVKENNRKLDVHHINHDKGNCEQALISLCARCHSKVNNNKEHYQSLLINILKQRGLCS